MKELANDCLGLSIGLLIAFVVLEYGRYGGSSLGEYLVYFGWAVIFISAVVYYFHFYKTLKSEASIPQKVKTESLYNCLFLLISAICLLVGYYLPGSDGGLSINDIFWNVGVVMDGFGLIGIFSYNYLALKKLA